MLLVLYAALLGLIVGSAINALVWRLYVGRSWVRGRSECPECGHRLGAKDLVPVVSWLLLRGRCRYCRKPIKDSPMVEIVCGAAFAVSAYVAMPMSVLGMVQLIWWWLAVALLLAMAVYDLRWMLLPDKLTLPLMAWAVSGQVVFAVVLQEPRMVLGPLVAGVLAGAGFFALAAATGGRAMGGGDIKLAVAMGLLLGLRGTAIAMLVAFNSAAIVGLTLIALHRRGRRDQIPFGPFLVLGTLTALWFTPTIVSWYLSWSGLG